MQYNLLIFNFCFCLLFYLNHVKCIKRKLIHLNRRCTDSSLFSTVKWLSLHSTDYLFLVHTLYILFCINYESLHIFCYWEIVWLIWRSRCVNIRFISKFIRPIIKQLLQKRSYRAGIATGGYLKGRLVTFN